MGENNKKVKSYPFEFRDKIVSRIEGMIAGRFVFDNGRVPQNDIIVEFLSSLHLELTKAPSINPSVFNRLTREFRKTKDIGELYLNMLPDGMRQHIKSGEQMLKLAISKTENGFSPVQSVIFPNGEEGGSAVINVPFQVGDKIGAMADIVPYLDHDLFDEEKWKNESDKSKFARFQMINTTRMVLREIWAKPNEREAFKKRLSAAYRNQIEVLGDKAGLFEKTENTMKPKRPYQPDFLIQKWAGKDPLFSGKQFDKLIEKFTPFDRNKNVAWVQTLARRQTSIRKNTLKEEFREVKKVFLMRMAQSCEEELKAKGVKASVLDTMKEGRLPANSGYDVEHLGDRGLGGTNDHDNLCFVDRQYNAAAAEVTSFQTLSLLPGGLRAIYEPLPKELKEAEMVLQVNTDDYRDGYMLNTPDKKAIVPLDKRIFIVGELQSAEPDPG